MLREKMLFALCVPMHCKSKAMSWSLTFLINPHARDTMQFNSQM